MRATLASVKRMVVVDYRSEWPTKFQAVAADLRAGLGDAALRVDHIGSTSVPGLAAKDVIDIQVTVADLSAADEWPEELLPGLLRREGVIDDHVPPTESADPLEWAKRYWSKRSDLHVHVRQEGRRNQRYALLFRDHLRADAIARDSYGALKRALCLVVAGEPNAYYAVKDPACDLIIAGAEQWAQRTAWRPGPSDG